MLFFVVLFVLFFLSLLVLSLSLLTISNFEVWLRRQTGDLIGSFFESRHHLSLANKHELVRFYLSVAILRMRVAEGLVELMRVKRLSEWEVEAHEKFGAWPWGEQMLSAKVMSMTPEKLGVAGEAHGAE